MVDSLGKGGSMMQLGHVRLVAPPRRQEETVSEATSILPPKSAGISL